MIPGAQDLLVAYPQKDHTLAREVDISFYRGDGCWFSSGRYVDLIEDMKGFWLCDARPEDGDGDMAMHIVVFGSVEDMPRALEALDLQNNKKILESLMFISGAEIHEL